MRRLGPRSGRVSGLNMIANLTAPKKLLHSMRTPLFVASAAPGKAKH